MKRMASCECEPARSSILCSFKQTMTGVQQTPSRCSERPQNGEGQERCNRNQPGDLRSQFCWPCRCSSICRTREESFDARERNLRAYVTLLRSDVNGIHYRKADRRKVQKANHHDGVAEQRLIERARRGSADASADRVTI